MQKNQSGFSTVFVLLVLVVLVTVGGIAWKVTNNTKQTALPAQTTHAPATQSYTDSANQFTFKFPAGWSIIDASTRPLEGSSQPEPDWSKQSRPINVKPVTQAYANPIEVTPGCEVVASDGSVITVVQDLKNRKDQFHTQSNLTINGYDAFYDKTAFKGDAETYTDHTYVISHGSNCLKIHFRQDWHNATINQDFDDTKYMAGFNTIVHTVHFN